jgi:hypothetical protein
VVATLYADVSADQVAAGASTGDGLAAAVGAAAVFLTITSAAGILLAWLAGRHRPPVPMAVDYAAAAAAGAHTLPTPHPSSAERFGAGV